MIMMMVKSRTREVGEDNNNKKAGDEEEETR